MSVTVEPAALARRKVRTWLVDLDRRCVSAMFSAQVRVVLRHTAALIRRVERARQQHQRGILVLSDQCGVTAPERRDCGAGTEVKFASAPGSS